jgi:hypothetical protein
VILSFAGAGNWEVIKAPLINQGQHTFNDVSAATSHATSSMSDLETRHKRRATALPLIGAMPQMPGMTGTILVREWTSKCAEVCKDDIADKAHCITS